MVEASKVEAPNERARLVLMGASNLTQGLLRVLEEARARLGTPFDAFAALGRGRSYGDTHSWFLIRRMQGMRVCGLWERLGRLEQGVSHALVTDVGNDLPFGARPETILNWVGETLTRLEDLGARCLVTGLPLPNLHALSPLAFAFWRRVIFPTHNLSRADLLAGADELDRGLRELCAARGHTLVTPDPGWYGVDPVHLARSKRRTAWRQILHGWRPEAAPVQGDLPRAGWPDPLLCVPQRRWLMGFEQRREQPCARVADSSTLSLY